MSNSKSESSVELYDLSTVCSSFIEIYKEFGKNVQSPALRRMLETVINQKTEQATVLKNLCIKNKNSQKIVYLHADTEIELFLQTMVGYERFFASILDEAMEAESDEETRLILKTAADNCRKFAFWLQDHLDLLSLF